jgi:hypothetical protein
MTDSPKTEWIIKDQSPAGTFADQQDAVVALDFSGFGDHVQGIEVRLADRSTGIGFSFAETHALVAALKAALKEWTRRGVV